jgi:hypothetical protein
MAGGGCGFNDDQPPGGNPLPQSDGGILPTSDGGGTSSHEMAPPVPDPLPPSVCTDSVAVQGTADPGASVIVFGGASSAVSTDAHPVTGRFCLDVPLVKNTTNTLQIRAQDPILGLSQPVTRTVNHSGSCGDDVPDTTPDQPKAKNIALGSTGKSKDTPEEGNVGFLTDGDAKTFVKFSGGMAFTSYGGWVYIKLDKVYTVGKIVVKWRDSNGNGEEYGQGYKVLISPMSDPGDPDLKNGYWTTVADIQNGDGGTDDFDLKSSKPIAQYVALWLDNDGNGSITDWYDQFAISEIEVWDVPQTSAPVQPTQQNTCATLGSGS